MAFRLKLIAATLVVPLFFGGECQNQPLGEPTAELGFTNLQSETYSPILDGDVMPLFTGGQGGSHIFATIRITNFPANGNGQAEVLISQLVQRSDDGTVVHQFDQQVDFQPIGNGVFEEASRFVFLEAIPAELHLQEVEIVFQLTSVPQPETSAEINTIVTLELQQ